MRCTGPTIPLPLSPSLFLFSVIMYYTVWMVVNDGVCMCKIFMYNGWCDARVNNLLKTNCLNSEHAVPLIDPIHVTIECGYDTISIHVHSTMQCPSIRIFRKNAKRMEMVWFRERWRDGGRRMKSGGKALYFDFHLQWLFCWNRLQYTQWI